EEVREARRARRETANQFLALNITGIAGISLNLHALHGPVLAWLCLALVLICLIWRASNSYYVYILRAKYEIIYDVEQGLGFDVLRREWHKLPRNGPFRWFSVERAMPFLLIIGYVAFLSYEISVSDLAQMFSAAVDA